MICWCTWYFERDPELRRHIRNVALMLGVLENVGWFGLLSLFV